MILGNIASVATLILFVFYFIEESSQLLETDMFLPMS